MTGSGGGSLTPGILAAWRRRRPAGLLAGRAGGPEGDLLTGIESSFGSKVCLISLWIRVSDEPSALSTQPVLREPMPCSP